METLFSPEQQTTPFLNTMRDALKLAREARRLRLLYKPAEQIISRGTSVALETDDSLGGMSVNVYGNMFKGTVSETLDADRSNIFEISGHWDQESGRGGLRIMASKVTYGSYGPEVTASFDSHSKSEENSLTIGEVTDKLRLLSAHQPLPEKPASYELSAGQ